MTDPSPTIGHVLLTEKLDTLTGVTRYLAFRFGTEQAMADMITYLNRYSPAQRDALLVYALVRLAQLTP